MFNNLFASYFQYEEKKVHSFNQNFGKEAQLIGEDLS